MIIPDLTIKTRQYPRTVFKLCDEDGNQLYSPYDKDGRQIKTACKVYINQDNYIPLPANYDGDTYTDFDTGIYFWHLEPEVALPNFDPIIIPVTVKISEKNEYPDYIVDTPNNNLIEDYANIYTLNSLNSYFKSNTDIMGVKLTLPNATDCNSMFYGCSALTDVNLSLPNATDCTGMFIDCSALTGIDLNLPNATDCNGMFIDCSALTDVDLSLPNPTSCTGMFYGCSALTDIKLNLPRIYTYTNMFYNCSNLETIDVTIPTSIVSDFKSYIDSLNLEHLTSLIINGCFCL